MLKTNSTALPVLLMKTIAINHSIPAYGLVIKIKKTLKTLQSMNTCRPSYKRIMLCNIKLMQHLQMFEEQ